MAEILIDANVYLRAYDSTAITDLLPTVLALGDRVFVSQQLVREVERNRLKIVARWLKQVEDQLQYSGGAVPKSLGTAKEIKRVSRNLASAKKSASAAEKEFKELAERRLASVAAGTDPVSRELARLFARAAPETPPQLERARARKEIGQLPGKPSDPLGDELTWEQYLEQLRRDDEAIVVSSDGDLVAKPWPGSIVVQPPLARELKTATGKQPRAFLGLSELLKHLSPVDARGQSVPSAKKLTAAAEVEAAPWALDFNSLVPLRYSAMQVPTMFGGFLGGQMVTTTSSLESALLCTTCLGLLQATPSGAMSCPRCSHPTAG